MGIEVRLAVLVIWDSHEQEGADVLMKREVIYPESDGKPMSDNTKQARWMTVLFGNLCAFSELQQALPGFVRTDRPLKLVLDRRPFI